MKAMKMATKVLTFVLTAVILGAFFFDFVTVQIASVGSVQLTGFEAAFGSTQKVAGNDVGVYKSAWYIVAFILSAIAMLFAGLSFKFKGFAYATIVAVAATSVNIGVLLFRNPLTGFLDIRKLDKLGAITTSYNQIFLIVFILAIAAIVVSMIALLVHDRVDVLESNGEKPSLFKRIKHFLKDYKSEITKIVWPTKQLVIRNTVVVLIMCAVVGAYIWVLDFGLAQLVGLVFGIKLV